MSGTDIYTSITIALKQITLTELLIFIAALLYVILVAIENAWGWLFGIIASALSVYLCFSGNLFLESGLNVFYVIIGIYGWYQWKFGSEKRTEITISKLSIRKNMKIMSIGAVLWIIFGYLTHKYSTQVLPYLDAFITAFSIIATWMTAKKLIENWLYWIIIDALGVLLFSYREFYLLALLNIIYTLIATTGYFKWRKKLTI